MNLRKINKLKSLSNEAKVFLKSEINYKLKTLSYRELSEITGLQILQIQRIQQDNFPKLDSFIKACQGILSNSNTQLSKKSRE